MLLLTPRSELAQAPMPACVHPEAMKTSSTLTDLPLHVTFLVCRHLNWEDLLALAQTCKQLMRLMKKDPLLWAFQLLKTYPREKIPHDVQHKLMSAASEPGPAISWQKMFLNMRCIQPAVAFKMGALPGWDRPDQIQSSLVKAEGSTFDQVLLFGRRCSFIAEFDALPPGKYVVMCRMKVKEGRKVYTSFTAKFGGKRLQRSNSTVVQGNSLSAAAVVAEQDGQHATVALLGPTPSEQGDATGGEGEQPSCSWPAVIDTEPEMEGMEHDPRRDPAVGPQSRLKALLGKLKPELQLLRGSYYARWQQVAYKSTPVPEWKSLGHSMRMLKRGLQTVVIDGPSALAEAATAAQRLSGRLEAQHETEAGSTNGVEPLAPKPNIFDPTKWNLIPVGTVMIKPKCRSTCISFVALSTNSSRLPQEAVPEENSVFIDHVMLQPSSTSCTHGHFMLNSCLLPQAAIGRLLKAPGRGKLNVH